MSEKISNICQLAEGIEAINDILGDTQGQYITFEEAVSIARTVYDTNLNNVIDSAVAQAQRSPQVLLTDAHTTIEAIEQYRSCPCKIDLRYVYMKYMKPLLADNDYYPPVIKYLLNRIENKCAEPDCVKKQTDDNDVDEETLEMLIAQYEDASQREAQARLDAYVNRGRYRFMEGVTPEVIEMFMNKVEEICKSIIDELSAKGITWKDPRNHG